MTHEGILLVNKPVNKTSFFLVSALRKITGVKKIGHAGTLDPFATGVMVMLIGKPYTRMAQKLQASDKSYRVTITLGKATDTYDNEGQVTHTSDHIPSQSDVKSALTHFQGTIAQTPPMFSAKKQNGRKLYDLARAGKTVHREPVEITLATTLVEYIYPTLTLDIDCSKGTYIRCIAHDLGEMLGCHAHASKLVRTRSGTYRLEDCVSLPPPGTPFDYQSHLIRQL